MPLSPVLVERTERRFWEKVDRSPGLGPTGECWVWRAGLKTSGYGKFYHALLGKPSWEAASRTAYRLADCADVDYYLDPDLQVLHTCDFRPCVRRSHLFLGTNQENIRDRVAKNVGQPLKQYADDFVRELRQVYSAGGHTFATLAVLYRIPHHHVADMVSARRKRHVT